MKIKINTKELHLNLRLPTALLCNKIAYNVAYKAIQKKCNIPLNEIQKDQIYILLKATIKEYKGVTLVDVQTSEQEEILIIL